jgi:hypothetical protein
VQTTRERRRNPRLRLCYPIETRVREDGEAGSSRSVTADLGARGAYYRTFAGSAFRVGQKVSVRIVVPHALTSGDSEVRIDMRTEGRVLRVEPVRGREGFGEDGVLLFGVAVTFDRPLEFRCDWM